MKRISAELAVIGALVIAVIVTIGLFCLNSRPLVSCSVVGQTNDASGQAHVVFQLSNSHSHSIFVGLYSVEAQTAEGWRSVRKQEAGEPLTGVPAKGTKRFSFSPPANVSAWRLRLIYSLPSSTLRAAAIEIMARLFRRAWPDRTGIITTPVISAEQPPQGGANGRQPIRSETNRTSAAAASRRSP
jgi:hypothetical protein